MFYINKELNDNGKGVAYGDKPRHHPTLPSCSAPLSIIASYCFGLWPTSILFWFTLTVFIIISNCGGQLL